VFQPKILPEKNSDINIIDNLYEKPSRPKELKTIEMSIGFSVKKLPKTSQLKQRLVIREKTLPT
jgi:hypothetical protein